MSEYDAFGRKQKGAPAGWGGAPGTTGGPTGGGSSGSGPRPSRPPGGRPPRRRRGGLVALFLVVDLVILLGVGAFFLVRESDPGSDRPLFSGGPGQASAPDDDSLLSATGSRRMLAQLRDAARPGERVSSLSIRDAYAVARLADRVGRERSLTFRDGKDPEEGFTTTATGGAIEPAAIPADAVPRLVAAVGRGIGPSSTAGLDYLVLDVPSEGEDAGWYAYQEDVPGTASETRRWSSDLDGRHVVRGDGAPAPAPGQDGPVVQPAGLEGASLLRGANLRRALAAARSRLRPGSLVTSAVVRPTEVALATRRGWREQRLTVDAALGVRRSGTGETTRRIGSPITRLDADAPARAIRKVDARVTGDVVARVDYVVWSPRDPVFPTSRDTWGVYLGGGNPATRLWRASRDGRRVGRPGTAGAP
jgi:hypothetical protein